MYVPMYMELIAVVFHGGRAGVNETRGWSEAEEGLTESWRTPREKVRMAKLAEMQVLFLVWIVTPVELCVMLRTMVLSRRRGSEGVR